MTDLLQVLPDLELHQFSHLLPSLERAFITLSDLLTLDAVDIAKRAQVPPLEVTRLCHVLVDTLHSQLASPALDDRLPEAEVSSIIGCARTLSTISTLDPDLDTALGGGFPAGHLSEVTGESAAGKTQLLLSLLLAVQLPPPHGLSKSALYITTEGPLQTTRLTQILNQNSFLALLEPAVLPSLAQIHSTKVSDLEAQEHILRYQVPVAIERNNVGLIIIDSVAANFRAEFDGGGVRRGAEAFAKRSTQLISLGALLRDLACKYNVAIVVANQVLDRFTAAASFFDIASQPASQRHVEDGALFSKRSTPTNGPGPSQTRRLDSGNSISAGPRALHSQPDTDLASRPAVMSDDPLALDHQQRFFTGWGDIHYERNLKTPSLGMTWTNQLAARVVLLKQPIYKAQDYVLGPEKEVVGWTRSMKIAFAKWCADDNGGPGTSFEIWAGGMRGVAKEDMNDQDSGLVDGSK